MGLVVDVFVLEPDGEMRVLDVPEGSSGLAGGESWRTEVWGSQAVRELGARFFPALADGDLMVAAAEVPAFLRECALLRGQLDRTAAGGAVAWRGAGARGRVSARLANIEAAARRARERGGGVLVW